MRKKAAKRLFANLSEPILCCICGAAILNPKELSKEHEPPLSRGGTKNGWAWAHKSCNNRKGALTQQEYQQWLILEKRRHGNER
ncbi:MAG: HNH endonuclease [Rickettsiales bacterium]|jgi:hypothetical protein|nr:HNH endonuclease [Rickettsiales bacterium]